MASLRAAVIDLLAGEDRSGFGIACALDVERIPYRRIRHPEDFDARLLIVSGGQVTPAVLRFAVRTPTLIIGSPASPPRELFGVGEGGTVRTAAEISLQEPIWPEPVRVAAHRFGKEALRVPKAPAFCPDTHPGGTVLAKLRHPEGALQPAIVRSGSCHWSLVDLGVAFAHLLDESYLPPRDGRTPRPLSRSALLLYYRAPESIRRIFQRRVYRRLHAGLAQQSTPSEYPVDATGWLLLELLKQLVRSAAGGLVRVGRWPAPYTSAATLAHDLEPTRFAYTQGLEALAGEIGRSGHPPTFGVVAGPAARYLTQRGADHLRGHDVLCHGLEHRGETLAGSREAIAHGISVARARLEKQLDRRITGFRSPRLDRSPDLPWALERAGFRYDSSYPDVDRENMSHFGAGVRLNVPYRLPLAEGERLRPSACLELPVSAPDCIQPLFEGDDVRTLRRAVREKVAFVHATGGLYVGIVHAGVFGARDSARRTAHLAFVRDQLRHRDIWLATASEIAEWWFARERLEIELDARGLTVANRGDRPAQGVRVVLEYEPQKETICDLPPLAPGASARVEIEELSLLWTTPGRGICQESTVTGEAREAGG